MLLKCAVRSRKPSPRGSCEIKLQKKCTPQLRTVHVGGDCSAEKKMVMEQNQTQKSGGQPAGSMDYGNNIVTIIILGILLTLSFLAVRIKVRRGQHSRCVFYTVRTYYIISIS